MIEKTYPILTGCWLFTTSCTYTYLFLFGVNISNAVHEKPNLNERATTQSSPPRTKWWIESYQFGDSYCLPSFFFNVEMRSKKSRNWNSLIPPIRTDIISKFSMTVYVCRMTTWWNREIPEPTRRIPFYLIGTVKGIPVIGSIGPCFFRSYSGLGASL